MVTKKYIFLTILCTVFLSTQGQMQQSVDDLYKDLYNFIGFVGDSCGIKVENYRDGIVISRMLDENSCCDSIDMNKEFELYRFECSFRDDTPGYVLMRYKNHNWIFKRKEVNAIIKHLYDLRRGHPEVFSDDLFIKYVESVLMYQLSVNRKIKDDITYVQVY